ncbi:MAG: carbon storage regulator [Gammaproteobacteria bacterium]|nr:carbon storage regulator [Gammaproteobacteria bacterium]
MLIISRRPDEDFYIYPDYSKLSPQTKIGDIFGSDGCVTISINKIEGQMASVGIDAPIEFTILRSELDNDS